MVDDSDFYPSSPVPGDKWLGEGETPFTDFGQWGSGQLDLRVFEQSIWWVDVHGTAHLLTGMSDEYLQNVLHHIFANVESFYAGMMLKHAIELTLTLFPEETEEGFVDHIVAKPSLHKITAVQWMNDNILVKRIIQILDGR